MSEKNGHVLSQRDIADYNQIIARIETSLEEASRGLIEIRDRKLYLLYADTFEEWGKKVLKRGKSWLYDQIQLEEVRQSLPPEMSEILDTDSSVRELGKLHKKRRMRVIDTILSAEKDITPKTIKEAAAQDRKPAQMPPEEPIDVKEVVYDATGYEVPEHLVEFYQQGIGFGKDLLTRVSSIRGALRRVEGTADPRFAFVSVSSLMTDLNNIYREFGMLVPHVVCPMCQGQVKSNCVLCRKTGFLPKYIWDTAVDSKLKAVRQKGIEQKKKG